jgi:hypothetical protein
MTKFGKDIVLSEIREEHADPRHPKLYHDFSLLEKRYHLVYSNNHTNTGFISIYELMESEHREDDNTKDLEVE